MLRCSTGPGLNPVVCMLPKLQARKSGKQIHDRLIYSRESRLISEDINAKNCYGPTGHGAWVKDIGIKKTKGPRPLEEKAVAEATNKQIPFGFRAAFMGLGTVEKEGNKEFF